ncbi:membrane protein implicated in regulation of membrane protease activity [Microbacterium resistens]|uniref:Membrane protein implicated in regulation of membrane protease activity n=1 Tax=Microbacterium resistens TaxID=156977 RepID=A0ABU1SDX1_9MICO|nr:hypothetical protein [Microbacterium resistens]MDR6867820.1 membrane protein implicated in regulation of membrane protease activity [Microbacterium resistens]
MTLDGASTDEPGSGDAPEITDEVLVTEARPQEGVLGLTLRELIIAGGWFLALIVSFFPVAGTLLGGGVPVWGMDGQWVLTIGVPTAAVFLLVLRRFSPEGIRRVGSLGIDQFASVAFSVAAVGWAVMLWQQMHLAIAGGLAPVGTWVAWAETVLFTVLVVLTVFAPLIPRVREDFDGRVETLAHRNANPVRPVVPRPRPTPVVAVDAAGTTAPDSGVPESVGISAPEVSEFSELSEFSEVPEVPEVSEATGGLVGEDGRAGAEDSVAPSAPLSSFGHASGGAAGIVDLDAGDDHAPRYARRGAAETDDHSAKDSTEDHWVDIHSAEDRIAEERSTDEHSADGIDHDALTAVFGDLGRDDAEHAPVSGSVGEREDELDTRVNETYQGIEPAQPFWALAPETRPVHDDRGMTIFEVGPDAWILVLEDRGGAYVVRHDDGRVGFLHDTTNMTRG